MNLSELCREFGISRETGYVWLRRYRQTNHDLRALEERSHRPLHIPNQVPQDMQDFIVAARKQRPTWGPRKLRAHLVDCNPGVSFPSESAIAAILQRNGLTSLRRRRRKRLVVPATRPFAAATGPNAVWCVDFKGWVRTGDGRRCYPLTPTPTAGTCCVVKRCSTRTPGTSSPSSTPPSRSSARRPPSAPTTVRPSPRRALAGSRPCRSGGPSSASVWSRTCATRCDGAEAESSRPSFLLGLSLSL